MLILTRRIGQKIVIDDEIILTVIEIRGKAIRLGVDAPKRVSIHRNEVHQAIADQTRISNIEQQITEQAAEA